MNSSIIDSVILSPELLPDFHRMVESVAGRNGQWVLCYRGSIHGWSAQTFHRRCDKKINTVTLVKRLSYVFGGFTDIAWGELPDSSCLFEHEILSVSAGNDDSLVPGSEPGSVRITIREPSL